MKTISRRNALLAGFSSLITFGITSAYAAPASVPVISKPCRASMTVSVPLPHATSSPRPFGGRNPFIKPK